MEARHAVDHWHRGRHIRTVRAHRAVQIQMFSERPLFIMAARAWYNDVRIRQKSQTGDILSTDWGVGKNVPCVPGVCHVSAN
jgi:hypothetical protein